LEESLSLAQQPRGFDVIVTLSESTPTRRRAAQLLAEAAFVFTDEERNGIEVADFGLSELDRTGLEVVVYVNTQRVCAKEIVMFPGQTCPEHRHPPFDGPFSACEPRWVTARANLGSPPDSR
jgi:D-lyxose ketol-isomerase